MDIFYRLKFSYAAYFFVSLYILNPSYVFSSHIGDSIKEAQKSINRKNIDNIARINSDTERQKLINNIIHDVNEKMKDFKNLINTKEEDLPKNRREDLDFTCALQRAVDYYNNFISQYQPSPNRPDLFKAIFPSLKENVEVMSKVNADTVRKKKVNVTLENFKHEALPYGLYYKVSILP